MDPVMKTCKKYLRIRSGRSLNLLRHDLENFQKSALKALEQKG